MAGVRTAPVGCSRDRLSPRHPADANLVLGHPLETAFQHLIGAPPAGWSTAEPVNLPWSTRQLTGPAPAPRTRRPTWLIVVGPPIAPPSPPFGSCAPRQAFEDDIDLALGYGGDETPPLGHHRSTRDRT